MYHEPDSIEPSAKTWWDLINVTTDVWQYLEITFLPRTSVGSGFIFGLRRMKGNSIIGYFCSSFVISLLQAELTVA